MLFRKTGGRLCYLGIYQKLFLIYKDAVPQFILVVDLHIILLNALFETSDIDYGQF